MDIEAHFSQENNSDFLHRRNLHDLTNLVFEMRSAQKHYFANRSDKNLENAKSLEKAVDKMISDLKKQAIAPTLFP